MAVMCVIRHTGTKLAWRYISVYILGSVHMGVMGAVKHSNTEGIWSYIYVYTLGNVHMGVLCVIKHSVTQVVWRYINVYIQESVHIAAMGAVRHSVTNLFWRNIFCLAVISSHNPTICVIHYDTLSEESSPFTDRGISISVVFWKDFPLCTDIITRLGKKSCMSGSARIFWKFRVLTYYRCLEMMGIVVYEYLLNPLIISPLLKQYL
jgi:hypothetical protein